MSDTRAFEQALAANPDDRAGWCAFADYLVEQGDPRGAFMQVQLALEDASRSREERDALKEREAELLAAHEREWLGALAPFLLPEAAPGPAVEYWWARGFISEMRVQYFTAPLARAVADAPAVRFLRKLHIETVGRYPHVPADQLDRAAQPGLFDYLDAPEGESPAPLPPLTPALRFEPHLGLIGASALRSVRVFQVGADADSELDGWTEGVPFTPGLEHLVAGMPRIEELYLLCNGYDAGALFALPNLAHLQVLRVYGLGGEPDPHGGEVPLTALARNPALPALTHLLVHPYFSEELFLPLAQVQSLVNSPYLTSLSHLQLRLSDMGDEGARAIIESGILKRLGRLDLRNGTITDAGARLFADYGPARNLRRLDLSRNRVTFAGLNRLRAAGVNAVADNALSRRESEAREREEREADME